MLGEDNSVAGCHRIKISNACKRDGWKCRKPQSTKVTFVMKLTIAGTKDVN